MAEKWRQLNLLTFFPVFIHTLVLIHTAPIQIVFTAKHEYCVTTTTQPRLLLTEKYWKNKIKNTAAGTQRRQTDVANERNLVYFVYYFHIVGDPFGKFEHDRILLQNGFYLRCDRRRSTHTSCRVSVMRVTGDRASELRMINGNGQK